MSYRSTHREILGEPQDYRPRAGAKWALFDPGYRLTNARQGAKGAAARANDAPMRRSTPGVRTADDLLPPRIRRAEWRNAEAVIAHLEPMVSDRRKERIQATLQQRLSSVTVLFDTPYDPHNGAAVIRSCEAFGVQSLHVVERDTRFLVSDTVTRGADKWVDVACHASATSAIELVRAQGFELVAAEADGDLEPADLEHIPKLALVLGAERDGVSEELMGAATRRVRVPMRGFVESLNVSVTAAILLAHATRNRPGDLSLADQRRIYARGLYFSVRRAEDVLRHLEELESGSAP